MTIIEKYNKKKLSKSKIVFIGWRNLFSSSGEWQLISNRARSIYESTGIATDAAVFVNLHKHGHLNPAPTTDGLTIRIFDVSPGKRFSAFLSMAKWISNYESKTCAIILSGIPSYIFIKTLKKFNAPIFIDIHGAYEEIIEYGRFNEFFNKLVVTLMNLSDKIITRYINGRLVVSNRLATHVNSKHGHKESFVIPCGVSNIAKDNEFNRSYWRQSYGWSNDTVVWNYCGGISPWQHVEEIIAEFSKIENKDKSFLWIMSPAITEIEYLCQKHKIPKDKFLCEHLSPNEVDIRLPAADIGFLLRDDNITNQVAFPNKFSQYVNCGLIIAMTKINSDTTDIADKHGISYFLNSPYDNFGSSKTYEELCDFVAQKNSDIRLFNDKCNKAVHNHLLYSTNLNKFICEISDSD